MFFPPMSDFWSRRWYAYVCKSLTFGRGRESVQDLLLLSNLCSDEHHMTMMVLMQQAADVWAGARAGACRTGFSACRSS